MLSSGFRALEGFIQFQRIFQLKSLATFMLQWHGQLQHSQTWLIELSASSLLRGEAVSVLKQVLARILKLCAYHLNLVLHGHLDAISGWYFGSMPLYLLQLNTLHPAPTFRSTEIYSSMALGPEGQRHQTHPGGTQPPSLLSPHACFQLAVHRGPIGWGGNHMLCAFCKEWFMRMGKNQPQLRSEVPDV